MNRYPILLLLSLLLVAPPQTEALGEDYDLSGSLNNAQQLILQAKKLTPNSQQRSDNLQSSLSLLQACYDNRNAVPVKTLISNRYRLFNALRSLSFASIETGPKDISNPLFVDAERLCRQLADDPNMPDKIREEAYLTCSTLAAERGDRKTVLEILDTMVKAYPGEKLEIGHTFLNIAEYSEQLSIEDCDKQRREGNIYPPTSPYEDQAFAIYDALSNKIPDCRVSAEARKHKANLHIRNQKLDNAIEEYEAILSMKTIPEDWKVYSRDNIGHIYTLKGEDKTALKWYQSIIDEHPRLTGWHPLALSKTRKLKGLK